MKLQKYKSKYQRGVSLMEILISLLVLSVGLLGLAALQGVSLKANHGAYQKSQATFLAYDIVDRLRANRTQAIAESYDIDISGGSLGGTTLAAADVNDWLTSLSNLLPSGDGSINCDNAGSCTVVVQWNVEREGGTAQDSSATVQQFSFTSEI